MSAAQLNTQVELPIASVHPAQRPVAGVDEVGRGPLAGPVVAAAVILSDAQVPGAQVIDGLADSKVLTARARERLAIQIRRSARCWAIGRAEPLEIDEHNILAATMLAMQRAVAALGHRPVHVLVDGNRCPSLPCPSTAIIKGDARVQAISAASIIAKVYRDQEMNALDERYPGYGFARHKGYATRFHLEMLRKLGPCVIHRRSFAPVRAASSRSVDDPRSADKPRSVKETEPHRAKPEQR